MPLSDRPEARERQLANLRPAPPAPLGHTRTLRHGAHASPKTLPVEGKARVIFEQLAAETPLREGDNELPLADRVAVELLALSLCRIESVEHYLQLHGVLDEKGNVRPAAEHARRLRAEAKDHCSALGLTPRARVALGIELQRGQAFDLAQAMSDLPDEGAPDD